MYALPYDLYEQHAVRKYGFHGTSYLYLLRQASQLLNKPEGELNLIACHIGITDSLFLGQCSNCTCASVQDHVVVLSTAPLLGLFIYLRTSLIAYFMTLSA